MDPTILITPNFSVGEFTCKDGTEYPLMNAEMRALPTGYTLPSDKPKIWRWTRLYVLCLTLETLRQELGNKPVTIDSGFRSIAYDQKIYEAHVAAVGGDDGLVAEASKSQHPMGDAADIIVAGVHPVGVFNKALQLFQSQKLPHLGGIGLYSNFVHIDVRPRPGGSHLAIWGGARPKNVV